MNSKGQDNGKQSNWLKSGIRALYADLQNPDNLVTFLWVGAVILLNAYLILSILLGNYTWKEFLGIPGDSVLLNWFPFLRP